MTIPYELTGRRDQKARTRKALIQATRELIADAVTPTVEQAAAAASISRTTAYRYFPNQRSLLLAAHPEIEAPTLLGEDAPEDAGERFERVVEAFARLTVDTEPELRTMLRLSLESDTEDRDQVLRQGRAIGWLEEALAPVRDSLSAVALRRLVVATRAACGIEALVWLTDVAGLSREEAVDIMRWSARALYAAAVAEASADSKPRSD